MKVEVRDNEERKRFETSVQGKTAFIDYIRTANTIYLTHTEVPEEMEGQGIGSGLVGAVLEKISQTDRNLAPLCPFVAGYIKKNPQWKDLVDKRYNLG